MYGAMVNNKGRKIPKQHCSLLASPDQGQEAAALLSHTDKMIAGSLASGNLRANHRTGSGTGICCYESSSLEDLLAFSHRVFAAVASRA